MSRATAASPAWTLAAPLRSVAFVAWFAAEILRSSATVLRDVLTPGSHATPRVVRVPVRSRRPAHTATFGALITLTPGTLTLGVVEDDAGRTALLVHSMYHRDGASALRDLADMEHRMLRGLTLRGSAPHEPTTGGAA